MTILIVEDDQPLRETFADVLRQVGYRVTAAANGRDALARIRDERPTFIFIDLVMPIMSGFELIQALKADRDLSTIPIVAMTASGTSETPGAMVMKKPFRAEAAVGLIEMHRHATHRRAAIAAMGEEPAPSAPSGRCVRPRILRRAPSAHRTPKER